MTLNLETLKRKVWQVDGVTVTVGGLVLVIIVGFLIMRAYRK